MFLPYADSFLTDIAQSAIDGACFSSDVTDQFLTMLAMENVVDYDGGGDFGSLSRIDLDDELRVVLTLVDAIADDCADKYIHTLASHYAQNDVMIGEGGTMKWWADWYPMTTEDAEKAQERFATAYSLYLGCEDCGHGYEDDPCICGEDAEAAPSPSAFLQEIQDAERMGTAFGPAE